MLTSRVQNCDRALERMVQCIVLAVGALLPYIHLESTDVIHMMNAQAFPVLNQLCIIVNTIRGGLGTRLHIGYTFYYYLSTYKTKG